MPFNPLDHPIVYTLPQILSGRSAWIEHIPFAYYLMESLRPATFVELGTFHGDSYFAFCQAVAQLKLPTRCYAVDHWKGDEHAGQLNAEAIYKGLTAFHDPRYASFSELIRSSFDDAAPRFEAGSIDLLHIDGLHTYEAVKHDYETWLPKLSSRGVVLFHDTAERAGEFGVYKLWEEISPSLPHFEFLHGRGLGVLAVGPEAPSAFVALLKEGGQNPAPLRDFFAAMGSRITFLQTQQIFLQQTVTQRSYVIQWARATGRNPNLPPFTPQGVANQPVDHSLAIVQDFRNIANEAVRLHQQVNPPRL